MAMPAVIGQKIHTPIAIGNGRPAMICPLQGENASQLVSRARKIEISPADVVEWRVDTLAERDPGVVRGAAQVVRREVQRPLIATFRSTGEGGQGDPADSQRVYETVAPIADALDVEYSHAARPELLELAYSHEAVPVLSYHNFERAESADALLDRLERMQTCLVRAGEQACQDMPADQAQALRDRGYGVVKVALTARNEMEALMIMAAGCQFERTKARLPLIVVAMGRHGIVSRAFPRNAGSSATFVSADGQASAPGQIDAHALADFYARIGKIALY
ncbi:type I 3-dehydroquinate dehydratase [Gleimia hominis]|uniref:3-dehydroquinate dehydratase n=1 Tax=Gleimia hominis TaxID=595468 RepID=A0ABU3IAT5_9ACTO|nr:type I 3-dehydroquinate dehydratase [Gleimia hominis]MDT3767492.1 type I 3-dehydroquinate dehydratase [Gleimia hominis]